MWPDIRARKTSLPAKPGAWLRPGAVLMLLATGGLACAGSADGAGKGELASVNTGVFPKGRMTSSGSDGKTVYFQYDARGRTTAVGHAMEGVAYVQTTTYGYPLAPAPANAGSVVVSETFSDNERVNHGYDAGGREQTLTAGGAQVVNQVQRDAQGRTIYVSYGDGTSTARTYNQSGDLRLKSLVTKDGGGTVLAAYSYRADVNGNILGVDDHCAAPASAKDATAVCCDPGDSSCSAQPLSSGYFYDSLDRVTMATSAASGEYIYGYDDAGNLTAKEGTSQCYGASCGVSQPGGPHALATAGGVVYGYDSNGNAVTAGGVTLTWSAENMPVKAISDVDEVDRTFVGDAAWKKVDGDGLTYYLPSERIENGKHRKYYGTYAERDPDDNGALEFYHGDHLGSSTLVTKNGAPVHRAAYYAYGEKPDGSERVANSGQPFTPRYQFVDKEKDSLGLYDFGARLLDPTTGRFLSADTLLADGPNRYAYARNNPLRYTDPSGHAAADDSCPDCAHFSITHTEYTGWHKIIGVLGAIGNALTGPSRDDNLQRFVWQPSRPSDRQDVVASYVRALTSYNLGNPERNRRFEFFKDNVLDNANISAAEKEGYMEMYCRVSGACETMKMHKAAIQPAKLGDILIDLNDIILGYTPMIGSEASRNAAEGFGDIFNAAGAVGGVIAPEFQEAAQLKYDGSHTMNEWPQGLGTVGIIKKDGRVVFPK